MAFSFWTDTSIDFFRLKDAAERKTVISDEVENHAKNAVGTLKRMYGLIDDPNVDAPPAMKTEARRNVKKILDDVDSVKRKFDDEVQSSNIAERFWKQVKTAREHFNEELQILFPNININDKKFSVNEDAFDLFVLHMYHKVNYLQKELEKMQVNLIY